MFLSGGSAILLALALHGPTTSTTEQVTFFNTRFLPESGNLESLGGGPHTGARVGSILAEFNFQSNEVDPVTGLFVSPELAFYWAIEDGQGNQAVAVPDGSWIGVSASPTAPLITSFDASTGASSAEIKIPIGLGTRSYRYPHLLEGAVVVDIVAGWPGELGLDSSGEPTGVSWQGSISIDVDYPTLWVDLLDSELRVHESGQAVIRLDAPATAQQTLTLSTPAPHRVGLPETSVTFESGDQAIVIDFDVHEEGLFVIEASDGSGTSATSQVGQVEAPNATYTVDTAGGVVPAGGSYDLPPPPAGGTWKECKPAQGPGSTSVTVACGICVPSDQTPQANCTQTMYQMTPAYCKRKIWSTCTVTAPVDITSPQFDLYSTQIVQCGSAELSLGAKIKKGAAQIGVGGTVYFHKLCCTYIENPTGTPVTVSWANCQ